MAKKDLKEEMSLEEAKAYRASLYKPVARILSEEERREQFKLFWAVSRRKYNKSKKELENVLWVHLKATGNDESEKFEDGLNHFGLKKIG